MTGLQSLLSNCDELLSKYNFVGHDIPILNLDLVKYFIFQISLY
jgi:hypothetical protein